MAVETHRVSGENPHSFPQNCPSPHHRTLGDFRASASKVAALRETKGATSRRKSGAREQFPYIDRSGRCRRYHRRRRRRNRTSRRIAPASRARVRIFLVVPTASAYVDPCESARPSVMWVRFIIVLSVWSKGANFATNASNKTPLFVVVCRASFAVGRTPTRTSIVSGVNRIFFKWRPRPPLFRLFVASPTWCDLFAFGSWIKVGGVYMHVPTQRVAAGTPTQTHPDPPWKGLPRQGSHKLFIKYVDT